MVKVWGGEGKKSRTKPSSCDGSTCDPPPAVMMPQAEGDDGSGLYFGSLTQSLGGTDEERSDVARVLRRTNEHLVEIEKGGGELLENCKNQHRDCSFWASIGECEANPSYMKRSCAPACATCHLLKFENRCPFPDGLEETAVFKPGDMGRVFQDIKSGVWDVYKPIILSEDPWIVVFDDFLSAEEAEHMIEVGHSLEYKRSADVGKKNFDGSFDKAISSFRTSENSWCNKTCREDPIMVKVDDRIERVTTVPYMNSEYLQLLKYEPNEYYKKHHDYIMQHHTDKMPCGPRVLTLLLYLNDVEAGGGTSFPDLEGGGVEVQPRRGRAVLWPSVRDDDPRMRDIRTMHEALPVERGQKFAANAWLHLYDFKTPHTKGCTG